MEQINCSSKDTVAACDYSDTPDGWDNEAGW